MRQALNRCWMGMEQSQDDGKSVEFNNQKCHVTAVYMYL